VGDLVVVRAAAQQVADNYRRFVQIYDEAAKQAAPA